MENRNQGRPEDQEGQNQRGQGQRGQQGQDQSGPQNQSQRGQQDQSQRGPQGQGQSGAQGQGQRGMENQGQQEGGIGRWEAWAAPEGNTMHLHVKGSFPTDVKNQNFTLKPAASQGASKSQLILEIDQEGFSAQGK